MKKKIISLALVVAMIAIMLTSFTMAYFTDSEQATNEFAAGSVKIDLWETVGHKDGVNKVVAEEKTLGQDTDDAIVYKYDNVQPGDKLTKKVTVKNEGESEAYIALTIKQNNYEDFNKFVDDYFEKELTADQIRAMGLPAGKDNYMQQITNDIFKDWGLQYGKGANDSMLRYRIFYQDSSFEKVTGNVEVLGYGYTNVDSTTTPKNHNYMGEYFKGERKYQGTEMEGNFDSLDGEYTRMWIIYLKVPAGESYTADLTTYCPTYFDNHSAQAFDTMNLDVKAFAIQTAGFSSAKAAFTELFKADDCFAY